MSYLAAWLALRDAGRKPKRSTPARVCRKAIDLENFTLREEFMLRRLSNVLPEIASGRFIVKIAHHFFAVVDGQIRDIFPPKPGRIIKAVYQYEQD